MHGAPVLYRGLAHTVPAHFPLATSILSGSPTSYSYSQSTTDQLTVESDIDGTNGPALIGSEAKLVTSFQTLTGSRASWTGSIDMFSDEFLQAMVDGQTTGNEAFISDLSKWTFQEEGVLRTDAVRHFIEGERQQKEQYRVRENLVSFLLGASCEDC